MAMSPKRWMIFRSTGAVRKFSALPLPLMVLAFGLTLWGAEVTITGRVQDSAGAAVTSATITARSRSCTCAACSNPKKCDCCVDQVVRSDATGSFHMNLQEGQYTVQADVPGFRVATVDVTAAPGANASLEITVKP